MGGVVRVGMLLKELSRLNQEAKVTLSCLDFNANYGFHLLDRETIVSVKLPSTVAEVSRALEVESEDALVGAHDDGHRHTVVAGLLSLDDEVRLVACDAVKSE